MLQYSQQEMIKQVDQNGDQVVDYNEFLTMFNPEDLGNQQILYEG